MDVTIEASPGRKSSPEVTIEAVGLVAPAPAAEPVGKQDQDELERELRLVDAAISMVRRDVARRITLANMPLGHAVLSAAQSRGALYGVHVRAVRDAEDEPLAVVVELSED